MVKGVSLKGQRKNKRKKMLAGISTGMLFGFLASLMVTMMYMGGTFNTRNFLSAGAVYDFSQKALESSTQGWIYEEGINGHRMRTNGALKKYSLNGKVQKWKYLYIDIGDMSIPQMGAAVCYYGEDKKKILEQSVVLGTGENIIPLQADIPMKQMGIRILNARGEYLSISSMQIRTTVSGYTSKRMIKIFAAAYSGFILMFTFLLILRKRCTKIIKWEKKEKEICYTPMRLLQYAYEIFGDAAGQRIGKKLGEKQKNEIRIFLFTLLFFWSIAGNVMNWTTDKSYFRYHVLVCTILILLIAAVSWEKPLKTVKWKTPLAISWLCLCIGMIISDLFVSKSIAMVGLVLLLAGGYFIFAWGNTLNMNSVIRNMITALEFTFFAGTLYCMLFRGKKPTVHYNGLFRSADECSMYAVMMLGVFLTELEQDIRWIRMREKDMDWKNFTVHVTGAAISCYFIIRAAYITGFVSAGIILLLFAAKQLYGILELKKKLHIILLPVLSGILVAFGAVCLVHIAVKYLPFKLELQVEYQNELLTTDADDELKYAFSLLEPEMMDGVRQKEDSELLVVWKNYMRRLSLFGNGGSVLKVFRIPTLPENGFIMLMYRYGIFIMLPYLIWQICFIIEGIKRFGLKKGALEGINTDFFLLTVGVTFTSFCSFGNVEAVFGHPLWICTYLGMGIWFGNAKINLKGK